MYTTGVSILKKAPLLKLLLPLMAGILLQWKLQFSFNNILIVAITIIIVLFTFRFLPLFNRFRHGWLIGVCYSLLFMSTGAVLTYLHDIRHQPKWIGHHYRDQATMLVTLEEVPVEKKKSFKILASAQSVCINDSSLPVKGNIILYIEKDSAVKNLQYGQQLVFNKNLQRVKNAGNPGGFNYQQYCLFEDITHQVYLKKDEFVVLEENKGFAFTEFLITTRQWVVSILQTYIPGKEETGLAQALLIGYKNDLDKDLVQAYSRTGVVHIIAISGLHLGMIYLVLVILLKPLKRSPKTKWLPPLIIILFLWLFSLLAGGEPSVLRSALMFTCIVSGEFIARKPSVYNTLSLSAIILLFINPYYLWDVGFQLSYAAVLSIVIFMQPIYRLMYVKNKMLDYLWQLCAVTLAAQLLTMPVSIYHFHQMPTMFLLANLFSVPLSGLILYGLLALVAISSITFLATALGSALGFLIRLMNGYIEKIDALPYSLWDSIQISWVQAACLLMLFAAVGSWLINKNRYGFYGALTSLIIYAAFQGLSIIEAHKQEKLVVYNIPGYTAMDFISGRQAFFTGNEILLKDDFYHNFHLKPSRIHYGIKEAHYDIVTPGGNRFFEYGPYKIMILHQPLSSFSIPGDTPIDLLIISGKMRPDFSAFEQAQISKIVLDGSVPFYRYHQWKPLLEKHSIPYHYVGEMGAFVLNRN